MIVASKLSESELSALCSEACSVVARAAEAIMAIYQCDFDVSHKADASPLTAADTASHSVLETGLKALQPRFPVLSEESPERIFSDRARWRRYWLIDPLDGTREFVKRNGEFAVNVALIEHEIPVIGIIAAPARGEICYAYEGGGCNVKAIDEAGDGKKLTARALPASAEPRVAVSRSHHGDALQSALENIGSYQSDSIGSSLKFIALASGALDLYPRAAQTCCEWDVAAGQCIVEQAGGALFDCGGARMRYNTRDDLMMPAFIACADPRVDWLERLKWKLAVDAG